MLESPDESHLKKKFSETLEEEEENEESSHDLTDQSESA